MKVLDTDTCVHLLRGNTRVIERRAAVDDDVVTTWITAGELFYGAAKSKAPAANTAVVHAFLDTLDVLDADIATARLFGELKAHLAARGALVTDADLLIASIALAHGADVVTGNQRHFARVPGVRCEDWFR